MLGRLTKLPKFAHVTPLYIGLGCRGAVLAGLYNIPRSSPPGRHRSVKNIFLFSHSFNDHSLRLMESGKSNFTLGKFWHDAAA